MLLIGIDCATEPQNTGLAWGTLEEGRLALAEVLVGTRGMDVVTQVASWLSSPAPALLALDAPLGWPRLLGTALHQHRAGEALSPREAHADQFFQRETDRIVRAHTGKRPLEVGADRIARTARVALEWLAQLREATGQPIPLAWEPGAVRQTSAIEVYPAATLRSRGWPDSGYKARQAQEARQSLLQRLSGEMHLPPAFHDVLVQSDHALDAAFCVLAAADFVRDDVVRPPNEALAHQEGWVWWGPRG